jgi:hypothetical protein
MIFKVNIMWIDSCWISIVLDLFIHYKVINYHMIQMENLL